jgi:hypothetical protein
MSDEKQPEAVQAPAPTPTPPPTVSPGKAYLTEADRTMKLQGRDYLQVADRVYAFRLDHPITSGWRIITEIVAGGFTDKWVIWKASVVNPSGDTIATGHKQEDQPPAGARGCAEWIDKGETGAIGRALGNCGYGTIAALEEDPDHPCDAPRQRGPQRPAAPPTRPAAPPTRPAAPPTRPAAPAAPKPAAKPAAAAGPLPNCVVCGKPLDSVGRLRYCESQKLPPSHSDPACSKNEKALTKGE